MAVEIIPIMNEVRVADVIPNYRFHLSGLLVNEAVSEQQKDYLQAFLEENFDVIKQNMPASSDLGQRNAYLNGAKDMLAFVLLWIDSLNIAEDVGEDITE